MKQRLISFILASAMATASVAATATPTFAAVQFQLPATVTVQTPSLNVRAGPGLNQAIVGILSGGETVRVLGKSDDGAWWKIC
jgi:uncharacterized protein YgiM (DUF1202 family)